MVPAYSLEGRKLIHFPQTAFPQLKGCGNRCSSNALPVMWICGLQINIKPYCIVLYNIDKYELDCAAT